MTNKEYERQALLEFQEKGHAPREGHRAELRIDATRGRLEELHTVTVASVQLVKEKASEGYVLRVLLQGPVGGVFVGRPGENWELTAMTARGKRSCKSIRKFVLGRHLIRAQREQRERYVKKLHQLIDASTTKQLELLLEHISPGIVNELKQ